MNTKCKQVVQTASAFLFAVFNVGVVYYYYFFIILFIIILFVLPHPVSPG